MEATHNIVFVEPSKEQTYKFIVFLAANEGNNIFLIENKAKTC